MALKLFLAFLFFPVSCLLAQEHNQSHPISCPKDFQCGKLGRLRFPFTNISKHDCGLCMVNCNNTSSPKIQLDWSSDQIFDAVSVANNSNIKLRDLQLQRLLNEKSCNTFYYKIYLPNSSSVSFKIASNTTTLFRCSHSPYLSHEIANGFYSNGYGNFTSCDGIQIFYRNPKYSSSRPVTSPPSCMTLNLPMRPWENVSEKSDLFGLLSFEFDLEWRLNPKDRSNRSNLIIITAAGILGLAVAVGVILYFKKKHCSLFWMKNSKDHQNVEAVLKNYGILAPKRYSYSAVKKMTNFFRDKLGQGGYGSVYKGTLRNGISVAVKILDDSKGKGEDFINEVVSVGRTSHVHIVALLGFCFEGSKRALIYELMPNGSLETFIFRNSSLTENRLGWKTLYQIAVGVARGLEYLHQGCHTRIIHFDIKPHNFLLDKDFCPKISDFGLAKLCPNRASKISMLGARGTTGYIAPEIFSRNFGEVSHKSDIYSYGMMILEMVGGRKNIQLQVDHTSEIYFPHWVYNHLRLHDDEIFLEGIVNQEEDEKARKMIIVGLWCIQIDPTQRPSISRVLEMFDGNLQSLQIPPQP